VTSDKMLVDAMTMHMVLRPQALDTCPHLVLKVATLIPI
jgi:isocitrate/isopropylmalate dehydrogenase